MRQKRSVPEEILSLSTFGSPDYVDVFTLTAMEATSKSPERWARAGIADAAGLAGQFLFRVILGLRLAPRRSHECVGGWRIARRGDRWIRLEAASWFLTAEIVVHVEEADVSVALFIRYDRPIAALVWPPLSFIHRLAMPGLLRRAAGLLFSETA